MTALRSILATLLCCGAGMTGLAVHAADLTVPPPPPQFVAPPPAPSSYSFLSEVRAGAFYHGFNGREEGSVDASGEILFAKPFHASNAFWDYFVPRFNVGGNANTAGKTSGGYGGLNWQFPVYDRFFGELEFGGEVNDGHTGNFVPRGFAPVGCSVMFREEVGLGYRISEHWNVMAIAEHTSNASLCNRNAGITDFGGKIGYVF